MSSAERLMWSGGRWSGGGGVFSVMPESCVTVCVSVYVLKATVVGGSIPLRVLVV